jgi:hypothetical protein
MKWHEEVKEHSFHGKGEGWWYVVGWYLDEHAAFKIAEAAWEQRQQECWEKNWNHNPTTQDLDIYDDYFGWNVTTPTWYLQEDGVWTKGGCYRFISKELAEETLKKATKPDRFVNYQQHLDNAVEPWSCRENT